MVKKHVEITAEDVTFIEQVKQQHPELSNFSAALRWVLLNARNEGSYGDQIMDIKQRLADLYAGQQLTNQLAVNIGDSLNIAGGAPVEGQNAYKDAQQAIKSKVFRYELEREAAANKPSSASGREPRSWALKDY